MTTALRRAGGGLFDRNDNALDFALVTISTSPHTARNSSSSNSNLGQIDGTAESSYSTAIAVQAVQTQFGNSTLGQTGFANGSELDQSFGFICNGVLYVTLAGNLESNNNRLSIFIDSVTGGQNRLRGDNATISRMGDSGGPNGLIFDSGFEPDYWLGVNINSGSFQLFVDYVNLPTSGGGTATFLGSTTSAASGDGILSGGTNPNNVRCTVNNNNTAGVSSCSCPCGSSSGAGVTNGVELAIPLAAIGSPTGSVKISAFISNSDYSFLSNQILGAYPSDYCNVGEPRGRDQSNDAGNQHFTVPTNAPFITVQPSPVSSCTGYSTSFSVTSSGSNLLYQWRRGGVALTDGSGVSGSTTATLSLNPVALSHAGSYDCVITNECGTATSNTAVLTVDLAPDQPINTCVSLSNDCVNDPGSPVCEGTTVNLISPINSGETIEWFAGTCTGSPIGSGSPLAVIAPNIGSNPYFARARNLTTNCVSVCQQINIFVVARPSAPTGVSASPNPACTGQAVTLSADAPPSGVEIVWYSDSCGGTQLGVGTTLGITASTSQTYYARARNTSSPFCTSTACTSVALVVNGPPTATPPASVTVCPGATVMFSVTAGGAGPFTYQWRRGVTNLVEGGDISNSQTAEVTIANVDGGDVASDYNCLVTGACGSTASANASLALHPVPDCSISTSPTVACNSTGNTASVPTEAGGTYLWTISGAGASITTGQGTNSIMFDAGTGPTVMLGVTVTSANLCSCTDSENVSVGSCGFSIAPGLDAWSTPSQTETFFSFGTTPIPAGFFDPGSEPFTGLQSFFGSPVSSTPGISSTDTIVRRTGTAMLPNPGSSDVVPIEIVALNLVSAGPIFVQYPGPTFETWNVRIVLSSNTPQTPGSMTIVRSSCPTVGGTYSCTLPVRPRFIFTRESDSAERIYDFGAEAIPDVVYNGGGHWRSDNPNGFPFVTIAPGAQIDHDLNGGTPLLSLPVGSSSNFFPGLKTVRCTGMCTDPEIVLPRPALLSNAGGQRTIRPIQAFSGALSCTAPPSDDDADRWCDEVDYCPLYATGQFDSDDDGIGDTCDVLFGAPIAGNNGPVCAGVMLTLNASPSGLAAYAWTGPDGFSSSDEDPVVSASATSAMAGVYMLTVTEANGCQRTAQTTVVVINDPPVAQFTILTAEPIYCGDLVTLDASGSTPAACITTYHFDWGDATTTTTNSPMATHAYSDSGSYAAELTVTDADGATDSESMVITITNRAPYVDAGGPYERDVGLDPLPLDGSASGDDDSICGDSIVEYRWDLDNDGFYDDHSSVTPLTLVPYSTLFPLGLDTPGIYPIRLQVEDEHAQTSDAPTTLTVYLNEPMASFTVTPNPAGCGQNLLFDASGSTHGNPNRAIVTYEWDFEDDATFDVTINAPMTTTTHTYTQYGTYTARLRVTDNNVPPRTDESTVVVVVNLGNNPPVSEVGGPYSIDVGGDLQLDGTGSNDPDAACGDSIASYEWDLGTNGTVDAMGPSPLIPWSTLQGLGMDGVGQHAVRLRVYDTFGVPNSSDTLFTIYPFSPTATFTLMPDPVCEGATVTLDASNSEPNNPNQQLVRYEWDIEDDGSYDIDTSNPVTTFAAPNWQPTQPVTVRLRVTDDNVPPRTAQTTLTYTVLDSTAIDVEPGSQTVCPGATVMFTVTAGGTGPFTYQWRRGLSNLADAGHYSGVTTQMLTVSNADNTDVATNYNCVVTGTCGAATTVDVSLGLYPAPTCVIMPLADPLCAGASSSANGPPGMSSYNWTISGGTPVGPTNQQTLNYTAGPGPSLMLGLTVSNSNSCTSSCNTTIAIQGTPTVSAGGPYSYCGMSPIALNGSAANHAPGSVLWTSGGDGMFANANALVTSYTPGPNDLLNGSVTLTLQVSAITPCSGTVQSMATASSSGTSSMDVSIALNGAGFPPSMTRCIRFELYDCPGSTPVIVNADIVFMNGVANNVPVLIPCGTTANCITVRDRYHTLRRTINSPPLNMFAQYVINCTGPNSLLGGNLNDDAYNDILDYGVWAGRYNLNYDSNGDTIIDGNTPCSSTLTRHADISGNGNVFVEDFVFLFTNFAQVADPNCCGLPGFGGPLDNGAPLMEVSVDLLHKHGMGDLAAGDLNHDGMLNIDDIVLALEGQAPTQSPPSDETPPGNPTTTPPQDADRDNGR